MKENPFEFSSKVIRLTDSDLSGIKGGADTGTKLVTQVESACSVIIQATCIDGSHCDNGGG